MTPIRGKLFDPFNVDGESAKENQWVEHILLKYLGPEAQPLKPHDLGGPFGLEVVIVVGFEDRMGEAEPGKLLPHLRQDIVEQGPKEGGENPKGKAEI